MNLKKISYFGNPKEKIQLNKAYYRNKNDKFLMLSFMPK